MCGGSGTRLWPISRKSSPKQFAPLFDNKSLFQLTIERNLSLVDEFIVVVNKAQLSLCQTQVPKIIEDKVKYIIEPVGRNTAPAITLATLMASDDDLLILASDHLIKDTEEYHRCVRQAQSLSQDGSLVTFGITPQYPETGYGYIEANGSDVLNFKEKPDLQTAQSYLKAGNYFWNSGMFLFSAKAYLSELETYQTQIFSKSKAAFEKAKTQNCITYIDHDDMLNIPADSIDYAVMEKSQKVKVVASDFNWSDLGSFDSLYEHLEKDQNNNTLSEQVITFESQNNLILPNKRLITTFNVNDLIIVDTEDALLIGKRGDSQNVKKLLEKVKEKNIDLLN